MRKAIKCQSVCTGEPRRIARLDGAGPGAHAPLCHYAPGVAFAARRTVASSTAAPTNMPPKLRLSRRC